MIRLTIFILTVFAGAADAAPREIDSHRWADVERIVAIGDLHGDYDNYIEALRAADIVDRRGRWIAGETHLVQTGDIPDRGPDTKKIIEHMARLQRQAHRDGGRVHNLIGNHEAMNVYGDLRYVTVEEFEAFATPRSERLRDRYLDAVLDNLENRDPDAYADLPDDFRQRWLQQKPLGWVEHRQAWDPNWGKDGEMYRWVSDARVAVQINDVVFVHGGISAYYCSDSLDSMTERARAELAQGRPDDAGILTDQFGPLWYRGLSGVAPEAPVETVDAILRTHDAARIVVGHTPTGGFIWPRYGGRVIQIDTGISSAYGGHVAYLEITAEGLFAGYQPERIELPVEQAGLEDYLVRLGALFPGNTAVGEKLKETRARATKSDTPGHDGTDVEQNSGPGSIPICGTRL